MWTFLKRVPLGISGLALSIAALGNLLGGGIRYPLGLLSVLLLVLYVGKWLFDFSKSQQELENPVPLSLSVTATMTLMVLSAYLRPHTPQFAFVIWWLGLLGQLGIMGWFTKNFILTFKWANVAPSWLVLGVGIVTASMTSPAMGMVGLGQLIFWSGFVIYFMMLAVVITRLLKIRELPEPVLPTQVIFTAPMSLLIVGYLQTHTVNESLLLFMSSIAGISYLYALYRMVKTWRLNFYPTIAAYTFPLVISAIAFTQVIQYFGLTEHMALSMGLSAMRWLAIVIVAYVLVRYLMFIVGPLKIQEKSLNKSVSH